MYDALLARHCAPTLLGLKSGSLFSVPFPKTEEMRACLRRWNELFAEPGIRALPLSRRSGRTLVYLYRPSALCCDLSNPQAAPLLTELGYPLSSPERSIAHLMDRVKRSPGFPHEIGLFLGYPPEDVLGFIRDPAACKLSGCWKVYGDVPAAQNRFNAYRKCTQACCTLFALGVGLEKLVTPR